MIKLLHNAYLRVLTQPKLGCQECLSRKSMNISTTQPGENYVTPRPKERQMEKPRQMRDPEEVVNLLVEVKAVYLRTKQS